MVTFKLPSDSKTLGALACDFSKRLNTRKMERLLEQTKGMTLAETRAFILEKEATGEEIPEPVKVLLGIARSTSDESAERLRRIKTGEKPIPFPSTRGRKK